MNQPTAPGCARAFVNHSLGSWSLPDLVNDAVLIVSELVTNAVRATGITDPNPTYADLEELALLAVQVRVSGESLFIEVWDDDREKPGHPSADLDPDECGRGLVLVAALSKHYGVSRYNGGGKIVWAELDAGAEIASVCQHEPTPLPLGCRRVVFPEGRRPSEHAIADLALTDQMNRSRECVTGPPTRRTG